VALHSWDGWPSLHLLIEHMTIHGATANRFDMLSYDIRHHIRRFEAAERLLETVKKMAIVEIIDVRVTPQAPLVQILYLKQLGTYMTQTHRAGLGAVLAEVTLAFCLAADCEFIQTWQPLVTPSRQRQRRFVSHSRCIDALCLEVAGEAIGDSINF
jgi:hypothetical protein